MPAHFTAAPLPERAQHPDSRPANRARLICLLILFLTASLSRAFAVNDDRLMSTSTGWNMLLNKTEAEITTELDKGNRITEMEVVNTSPVRLNVVVVRNRNGYAKTSWWHPGLTQNEISQWLNQHNARLTLLKPYVVPGGAVRYAVVMVSNTGSEFIPSFHYPNHTFTQISNAAASMNYRIVDIERFVNAAGEARYAAVTVANHAPWGPLATAVFAGWTLSDITNYLNAHPNVNLTKLEAEPNNRFLGIATQTDAAKRWYRTFVPESHLHNITRRFHARIVDMNRQIVLGAPTYWVVMVDNGMPVTGVPVLTALDDAVKGVMKQHGIPGASLSVARGGKLIYARGFGYQDVEALETTQPKTVFRMGSVSKTFTAVAMMRLIELGTRIPFNNQPVTLETRVFNDIILPAFGNVIQPADVRMKGITVKQLLNHTAGFVNDPNPMVSFGSVNKTPTCMEIVAKMLAKPLANAPGSKYDYSNFGPCATATAIQILTGMPYETYVKNHIIPRAGIPASQFLASSDFRSQRGADEAAYYDYPLAPLVTANMPELFGAKVPAPYGGIPLKPGASCGGWAASSIALVRYGLGLHGAKGLPVLTSGSYGQLFTPPMSLSEWDPSRYYGLGFPVARDGNGPQYLWHNGGMPGSVARLVIDWNGFTVAYVMNSTESPASPTVVESDMWNAVAKAILDHIEVLAEVTNDLFPQYGY